MTLSLDRCLRHIKHENFGDPSSEVTGREIVNLTGNLWSTLHPWNALLRPPYVASLVLNQPWIDLPVDFRTVVSCRSKPGVGRLQFVDLDLLATYMADGGEADVGGYLGSIVQPSQTSPGVAPLGPRIQIHPTPSLAVLSAFVLVYRAKFTELHAKHTDKVNIPSHCEVLFLALLRAVAGGLESPESGSLEQRVAEIRAGFIFEAAAAADGELQPNYGEMRNGAAEMQEQVGPESRFLRGFSV